LFIYYILREKNNFEMSKNLARYSAENNFVELSKLYIGRLNIMNNAAKNFDILATS